METKSAVFAGVDVGGTSIKIGLVGASGELLAADQIDTQPDKPPVGAFGAVNESIRNLLLQLDTPWECLTAIGLATPGPLDLPTGRVLTPFNLPAWRHQDVRGLLSDLTGKPVMFANDAGAAAFGEFWMGSGQSYTSLILLTLGTGIGGGIIIAGRSWDGAHSHAAEVGHILVDPAPQARRCSCGQTGHLEAYCSATGLVSRCREQLASGVASSLQRFANNPQEMTALQIHRAATDGDPVAVELVHQTAEILARGIVTLVHIIDPQVVLLGGAMNFGGSESAVGAHFLETIQTTVRQLCFPVIAEQLKIQFATLGAKAGVIGAAGLAKQQFEHLAMNHNL